MESLIIDTFYVVLETGCLLIPDGVIECNENGAQEELIMREKIGGRQTVVSNKFKLFTEAR